MTTSSHAATKEHKYPWWAIAAPCVATAFFMVIIGTSILFPNVMMSMKNHIAIVCILWGGIYSMKGFDGYGKSIFLTAFGASMLNWALPTCHPSAVLTLVSCTEAMFISVLTLFFAGVMTELAFKQFNNR